MEDALRLLAWVHFGRNNTHIQHVLSYNGIHTIEQLEATPDAVLLRFSNLGRKGVSDIRAAVPLAKWQVWTPKMQSEEFESEYRR